MGGLGSVSIDGIAQIRGRALCVVAKLGAQPYVLKAVALQVRFAETALLRTTQRRPSRLATGTDRRLLSVCWA
jgi:hypothetical protein